MVKAYVRLKIWIFQFIYKIFYSIILMILQKKQKKVRFEICNGKESIDLIIKNELSVSRFGDGEFNLIFSKEGYPSYQNFTPELKKRLLEVLKYKGDLDSKLKIAIPYIMCKTGNIKRKDAGLWIRIGLKNIDKIIPLLQNDNYLDSMCFNRWINEKENKFQYPDYSLIKKIWDKKKIVIIEGITVKIGVYDNLLDNAEFVERVLVPDSNSFQKIYEQMISWIIENVSKDKMLMIAAGPMGTIASYDLYIQGYRILDVGHISYNYDLSGQGKKCINRELAEKKYWKQVICRIE